MNFEKIDSIHNIWFYKKLNRFNKEVKDSYKIQDSGITVWKIKE